MLRFICPCNNSIQSTAHLVFRRHCWRLVLIHSLCTVLESWLFDSLSLSPSLSLSVSLFRSVCLPLSVSLSISFSLSFFLFLSLFLSFSFSLSPSLSIPHISRCLFHSLIQFTLSPSSTDTLPMQFEKCKRKKKRKESQLFS